MAKHKRKISQATIARLRAMRQKYGLGEFKKHDSPIRKIKHSARRVRHMARHKRYSVPRFPRARRYMRAHKKQGASELALIGYAMVGENLFDSLTKNFNIGISPSLLKIGAGFFLKKKSGLVGQLGTAMYTVELYKLGKQMSTGGLNLGSLFGGTTTTQTASVANTTGATFS